MKSLKHLDISASTTKRMIDRVPKWLVRRYKVEVHEGVCGDWFTAISPELMVSGMGETKGEARKACRRSIVSVLYVKLLAGWEPT